MTSLVILGLAVLAVLMLALLALWLRPRVLRGAGAAGQLRTEITERTGALRDRVTDLRAEIARRRGR